MRFLLATAGLVLSMATLGTTGEHPAGTIAFSSLAPRGWDLFVTDTRTDKVVRLTDHPALDYNAAFSPDGKRIAFVSERHGNMELYAIGVDGSDLRRLSTEFALDDHPTWSPDGGRLAFVSTRQPAAAPGRAWNAIYVMNSDGAGVERLSGAKAADYSPSWSPDRELIAFASGSGASGRTDLYVIKPDGSDRRRVVEDGGWPAFGVDGSLYFHRKRQGKWGIWRVRLDGSGLERISPADVEAYTPRVAGTFLVASVKRGAHRQVERLDFVTGKWTPVTRARTDHWNPSVSPDGRYVVYHRAATEFLVPHVETWGAPDETELQMLRLAGAFPAFSPDHKRFALTGGRFGSVDVMNVDGSDRKTLFKSTARSIFSLSWAGDPDRVAFSSGGVFQGPEGKVDILTVSPHDAEVRRLTEATGNDGFPSFSPDGKEIVFRSGRGGSKNLWIMKRDGSTPRRLTEGKWTDTMCDWSPTGEWIAFASDRDGDFEVWLIRPDGTGLRKLVAGGGRNNHPHFSPNGKWVVFTSKRAGFSAEEISLPRQPQPYGDLFAVRVDGTGLLRLTHNGFEEGTPAWGPVLRVKPSAEGREAGVDEY